MSEEKQVYDKELKKEETKVVDMAKPKEEGPAPAPETVVGFLKLELHINRQQGFTKKDSEDFKVELEDLLKKWSSQSRGTIQFVEVTTNPITV